jgi:hypothetical protein
MPIRQPKIGFTVSYRRASGKTADMVVLGRQEGAPPAPGSSTSASGGTLAAATYTYRISAVIDGIETATSAQKSQATSGTTSTVTVTWTSIYATAPYNRATAFKVYGRSGAELLMATVAPGTATQFIDTGSVTPSGAQPTDTDGVRLKDIHGKQLLSNVAKATTVKSTNAYIDR